METSRLAKQHGIHTLVQVRILHFAGRCRRTLRCDRHLQRVAEVDGRRLGTERSPRGGFNRYSTPRSWSSNEGKHVEVSTLMVTDANDTVEEAKRVADWVLTNLSDTVPMHFVRFHPTTSTRTCQRTPVDRLEDARRAVLSHGNPLLLCGKRLRHRIGAYVLPWLRHPADRTVWSECQICRPRRSGCCGSSASESSTTFAWSMPRRCKVNIGSSWKHGWDLAIASIATSGGMATSRPFTSKSSTLRTNRVCCLIAGSTRLQASHFRETSRLAPMKVSASSFPKDIRTRVASKC